jgi:hypothetical protein
VVCAALGGGVRCNGARRGARELRPVPVPHAGYGGAGCPIKPMLKAPGTNLLTLQCDEPLLTFAFKFNLRRYS